MEELELSWKNAKKGKGGAVLYSLNLGHRHSYRSIEKTHGLETEDLLIANPNRGVIAQDEGDESQSEL